MTSFWDKKIIKIPAIVLPWVLLLLNTGLIDLVQPEIQVSLKPYANINSTSTTITIFNAGKEPATNLRITFNPFTNIIDHRIIFHTEEIELKSTGPQNLIGTMNRLVNDQKIILETTLDIQLNQFRNYNIHVVHDAGSTNYRYDPTELPFALDVAFPIIWAGIMTALLIQSFLIHQKKKDVEKSKEQNSVKEPVKEKPVKKIKNVVSKIPPDPFIKISLNKKSYKIGDTVRGKWIFSGLNVGEGLWAGVFDPKGVQIENLRFTLEVSSGTFSSKLLKIEKSNIRGVYVVKTDTQFGPESSVEFTIK